MLRITESKSVSKDCEKNTPEVRSQDFKTLLLFLIFLIWWRKTFLSPQAGSLPKAMRGRKQLQLELWLNATLRFLWVPTRALFVLVTLGVTGLREVIHLAAVGSKASGSHRGAVQRVGCQASAGHPHLLEFLGTWNP